jgi:hypothetical protein
MAQFDTAPHWLDDDRRFGEFVFHHAMPTAIQTLDNDELQTLLIALLQEWRSRMQRAKK